MTYIDYSPIGHALRPAGKGYKVRNYPPVFNHPKLYYFR